MSVKGLLAAQAGRRAVIKGPSRFRQLGWPEVGSTCGRPT